MYSTDFFLCSYQEMNLLPLGKEIFLKPSAIEMRESASLYEISMTI